jgi:hypothetical protein
LTARLRLAVLLPLAAVLTAVIVGCALAAGGAGSGGQAAVPNNLELGKQLYRKYCGQCHAI